jgi:hypothetical protein
VRRAFVVTVLAALWLATAAANPLLDGLNAWKAGDYSTARQHWRQASDAGDPQAMYLLSQLLEHGEGGPAEPEEALRWLRASAEGGYAVAQFNLGNHYQQGDGVTADLKQAAYWWRLAALQGLAQAQYNLGSFYYRGDAGSQDLAQASWWYEQAAAQGSERARQALAILRDGGASRDDKEGARPLTSLPAALTGLALGPDWLLRQPPANYTIQILATTDTQAIRSFLVEHRLDRQVAIQPFRRGGETWYALLYGRFGDRQAARQAIATLPQPIRDNNPWIRQIGELHRIGGD